MGKIKGERGKASKGESPWENLQKVQLSGFAEVLGFFRAELYWMNIELGELKMTTWSFQTSLTKWDPVTRSGS